MNSNSLNSPHQHTEQDEAHQHTSIRGIVLVFKQKKENKLNA